MRKTASGIPSKHPQSLLLGNGINLLFKDPSWEKLIKDELNHFKNPVTYDDIKSMPATMQIVVATNDAVADRMKVLSDKLAAQNMTQERVAFLQKVLALPMDDILTANYSFELEIAGGMKQSKRQYSARLQDTFDLQAKHKAFRLYQFYETSMGKRRWHIHGDIAKPDTMLMGHYYYAKQLKAIQDCAAKTVRRYIICQRQGEEFYSYSWVDQFLTGDVYILGLGMYLCESDLWYLLCCKKRNFPNTSIFFYDKECSDKTINTMLNVYGVKVIDQQALRVSGEYLDFYEASIADIKNRMLSSLSQENKAEG